VRPELQPDTTDTAARRSSIIRHGILRFGLPPGALVFLWIAAGEYRTALERLRTSAESPRGAPSGGRR